VRDMVMAALDVLSSAGAVVSTVSVPQHKQVDRAVGALSGEGGLAIFHSGYFGAFTRTYYPTSLIAPINQMWAAHADTLAPRYKLQLIGAELTRRNYNGRVYAKAQNVRPTFIRAYDAALANVDVLVMPTCLMTAPKHHSPATRLEAIEDNLALPRRNFTTNTGQFQLHRTPCAGSAGRQVRRGAAGKHAAGRPLFP